jgi:hypothetical protein
MPFQHSLSCLHAGQWHLLFSFLFYFIVWHSRVLRNFFRKKVNKKLSTTPFAKKEVLLLSSPVPQSSKVENKVNFGRYFDWIGEKQF